MKYCSIRYQPNHHTQSAVDVGHGHFLISGYEESWTMICNQGHPRSVTPCSICVIHIPCACSLESSSFHIVPRITHCQPSKSLKPVHGVNLVYLKTFSDDVDINTLSDFTTLEDNHDMILLRLKSQIARWNPKFLKRPRVCLPVIC